MVTEMNFGRQRVDDELEVLRERLLEMMTATEALVRDAIIALTESDAALAAAILPRDDHIDRMDLEIEAHCLRLMARQQLLGGDVRVVSAALKIVTDIERIGDHAVDIARVAQRMQKDMVYKPLADIPRLGAMARAMLYEALESYIHRDAQWAERVIASDDPIDDLYARMRRELQIIMQQDPSSVMQASYLLFVAHYIERIGDHCCNIAERVVFMETGKLRGNQMVSVDNPAVAVNLPSLPLVRVVEETAGVNAY